VTYARWLAYLGDRAYELAIATNTVFNAARKMLGMPYWSLSAYLKFKVKNAAKFITNFEDALAREAKSRGLDGVIAGHIHHAEVRKTSASPTAKDAAWVEGSPALPEDAIARLRTVPWADPVETQTDRVFAPRPMVPEAA